MPEHRIVLADDHPVYRLGLRGLLEAENDLEVVGEASGGERALALVTELAPQVLVLDIEMGTCSGLLVASRVRHQREVERRVPTQVLVLSAHDDDYFVTEMMAAGVAGFLTKDAPRHEIVDAVRAVARGLTEGPMSPSVRERLRRLEQWGGDVERRLLSRREVDVLRLVSAGLANKEIAAQLDIASSTVKNHLANIFSKLGARSRVAAVVAAQRLGYLST